MAKGFGCPGVDDGSVIEVSKSQDSLPPIQPFISEPKMDLTNEEDLDISRDFFEDSFVIGVENPNDSLSMLKDRTFYDIDRQYPNLNFPEMEDLPEKVDDGEVDLEAKLVNMIWYWLDREMFDSAIFAAERLVYMNKSNSNSWFLLALSYYKADKIRSAHALLKDLPRKHMGNNSLFLLGKVSLRIKEQELAEEMFRCLLEKSLPDILPHIRLAESRRCYGPDRCSVLIFLAETLRLSFRNTEALKLYDEAWSINPFCWEAFENICLLAPKPPSREAILAKFSSKGKQVPSKPLPEPDHKKPKLDINLSLKEGPSSIPIVPEILVFSPTQEPILPSNYNASSVIQNKEEKQLNHDGNFDTTLAKETSMQRDAQGLVLEGYEDSSVKRPYDQTKDLVRVKKLDDMFIEFSWCQSLMTQISPSMALEALSKLPASQRKSPWVQCGKARMQLEAANYKQAKKAFVEARNESPYITSWMGYFSTVLWHLREDQLITLLVDELQTLEPMGYESMVAVGNAYSLQGWSARAIQAFQEAAKLDPLRHYAYTLAGHEYWGIKNVEAADKMFRSALQICPRAHSASFGLGSIALAGGKYHPALLYFNKALEVTPESALLKEKIATAHIKARKLELGLACYNEAILLAPSKDGLKFQKARVLIALGRFDEALSILLPLKLRHRGDGALHFTLGKLHLLMGNSLDAYSHLRWASEIIPGISGKVDYFVGAYEQGQLKDISSEVYQQVIFGSSELTLSDLSI